MVSRGTRVKTKVSESSVGDRIGVIFGRTSGRAITESFRGRTSARPTSSSNHGGQPTLGVREQECAVGCDLSHAHTKGLPIGSQAPRFDLPDLTGQPVSLTSQLARGNPVLVVFTDLVTAHYSGFLTELARRPSGTPITRIVIAVGQVTDGVRVGSYCQQLPILLQGKWQTINEYRLCATPSAVVIGFDGHIATESALEIGSILDLLSSAGDAQIAWRYSTIRLRA
jgi:hypothetical protein